MTVPEAVDGACREALGVDARELVFRSTAVGDVFGVRVDDGRHVVVKLHQPREVPETLAAVLAVQAHQRRAGFPCPEPLSGPVAVGDRYATIETMLLDGDPADTHDPRRRRLVAEALARHLEIAAIRGSTEALRRG